MYRLIDDVAARRLIYPAPLAGMPTVMAIHLPPPMRGSGLALGCYYIIVAETESELSELNAFLARPRPAPIPPELLDDRPSAMRSDDVLVLRYEPRTEEWPWLLVCRWPDDLAQVMAGEVAMARGRYTFEAFQAPGDADRHAAELVRSLSRRVAVAVRFLSRDQTGPSGNA